MQTWIPLLSKASKDLKQGNVPLVSFKNVEIYYHGAVSPHMSESPPDVKTHYIYPEEACQKEKMERKS